MVCRLCLDDKLLIDTFDDQLSNSETLRRDIFITTGVKISETDKTTCICQKCNKIIVAISKFRQNAQANNAILKKNRGKEISLPSSYRENVNDFDRTLLSLLKTKEWKRRPEESKNSRRDGVPIKPTVSRLMEAPPKINIPQEVLDDVCPTIILDNFETNSCQSQNNKTSTGALDKIEIKSKSEDNDGNSSAAWNNDKGVRLGCSSTNANERSSAYNIRNAKETKLEDDNISIFSKTGPKKNRKELTTILKELEDCFASDEAEFSSDEFIAIESSGEECEEIEDDNYSFVPSLIKPISEQVVLSCEYCNKMFKNEYQLMTHRRSHKRCEICNGIFRSDKLLKRHQRGVCFKVLAANLPSVVITPCDNQPNTTKLLSKASDGKDNNPTNEVQDFNEEEANDEITFIYPHDPEDFDVSNEEKRHIHAIFEKHENRVQKDFSAGTEPQLFVRYGRRREIVLENLHLDLKYYRIPIELVMGKQKSFKIACGEDPKGSEEIFSWSDMPVIMLKNFRSTSTLNTPNAPGQSVSNPADKRGTSVNLKRKGSNQRNDIYSKQKKVPSKNPNVLPILPKRKVTVKSSNGEAVNLPLMNTKFILLSNCGNEVIPNLTGQYFLTWNNEKAVPRTSTGNNFNLRVKSPDELNKLLCDEPFTI